jgi:transposase InsO family protein
MELYVVTPDGIAVTKRVHAAVLVCVHRQAYQSRAEAKQSIFEWIEIFSNRQRRHSSLGYRSPVVYEQQTCLS